MVEVVHFVFTHPMIQTEGAYERNRGRPQMKIDMSKLRWVLLTLYAIIVLGLLGIAFTETLDLPMWLLLFNALESELAMTVVVLLATLISQAVFVFFTGTINLCQPIRKRRAFLPATMAAFLLTVLVVALLFSLLELFRQDSDTAYKTWMLWTFIGVNWIGWSIAFLVTYAQHDRYTFAQKLLSALFRGSLLEFLVAIPSHVIVSRRPGCFVGTLTGLGVSSGIAVMLWAFGPGIILLFLRNKYKGQSRQKIKQKERKVLSENEH